MNSTMVHQYNRSAVEDGIAATSTSYLPSPSGSASVGPGVAYDHRVTVNTLGAAQHSLGPNVSLPHRPPSVVLNLSPPQIFALGLLPGSGITSNSRIPFTADSLPPATINFTPYPIFDGNVHVPPASAEANHGSSNYNHMAAYSPPIAGLVSVLPEQHPTINGTQSSIAPTWQRSSNIRGHPVRSDGGFFVSKDADHIPSARIEGAIPTHSFPDTFSSASSPGVYSTSSTFPPYPQSRFSTSAPVPQGPAYPAPVPRRGSSPPVSPPVSPSRRSFLSSAAPSEKPVPCSMPQKECTEQENSGRTLRSVRTRSEDVYAEYELSADRSGGRWVCQCGSTFVRDSDWERHAMHSLSHSEGGGYDCSICDISFTRSDAMSRHRRKKHGDMGARGTGG